jgi:hypothetical protein
VRTSAPPHPAPLCTSVIEHTHSGASHDLFWSHSPFPPHSLPLHHSPILPHSTHTCTLVAITTPTHQPTTVHDHPRPGAPPSPLCHTPLFFIYFIFVLAFSPTHFPLFPHFSCDRQSIGASPHTDYLCVGVSFFSKGLDSSSKWCCNPGFWKCAPGAQQKV